MVFAGQVTCGAQLAYSATYFFESTGLELSDAFAMNLGSTAIGFCCSAISWFLLDRAGRRRLFLAGISMVAVCLFIIGCMDITNGENYEWGQAVLCAVWLGIFYLTLGPCGWVAPAEVSSTRLRSKTVVLAKNAYYLVALFATSVQPYMINPAAWNWSGKSGFSWCGTGVLTAIWGFFRTPEPKYCTYEELDVLFAEKVPIRNFAIDKSVRTRRSMGAVRS